MTPKRPVESLPKCKYRLCGKPMLRNKDFCNHVCKHAEFLAIKADGGDGTWIYPHPPAGRGRPKKSQEQKALPRKAAAMVEQESFRAMLTVKRNEPTPARHRQKPTIAPQNMAAIPDEPRLFKAPRLMICPRCSDRVSASWSNFSGEQPHHETLPGLYVCEKCGRVRAGDGPEDEIIPALTIGASRLDAVTFTRDNVLDVPVCETTAGIGPADYVRLLDGEHDQVHACKVAVSGGRYRIEIGAQIGQRERMEL